MRALRPGLLRQDGVCPARVHDLHQHVQSATVHAEGDRERRGLLRVALQLSLFDATRSDAPARGGGRSRRCSRRADCVCAHQPAQLDEEPVRVGVLLLRAVDLFHALGGLLVAQAHAMQEPLDPALAGTDVEPFVHQASDRHSAEAQDV